MKIPLNMGNGQQVSGKVAIEKEIKKAVLLAKKGDWNAKKKLVHAFTPLITNLAEKRASETPAINSLVEAGKEGLMKAVKKYKPDKGENFQIFALDFIENAMDKGGKGGFFSKLFGG